MTTARTVLRNGVRRALVPLRRSVTTTVDRFPSLESRVSGWGWLWQPGWTLRRHERFYASGPDPYGFDSEAEQTKYQETVDLLSGRRYERALEVGAGEGHFTEQLLPLCETVVATDVSDVALARARRRLGDRPEVILERRILPFDFPDGTFDLVVCSDVLYYWADEVLERGVVRLAERLRPGGRLLLLHWRGDFGQAVSADTVHSLVGRRADELGLEMVPGVEISYRGPEDAGYLVDVFVRRAG